MSIRRALQMVAVALVAAGVGWFAGELRERPEGPASEGPCPGGATPLYWKAPMDPSYVRDAPGKSPMGMDLVPECPPASGVGAGEEGTVVLDSATVQKIGVRTTRVERQDLSRQVRTVGRVAYDERRVSHAHTKVQGWVERLFIDYVGQAVKRGQPLLEIYSPELVATQEELLLAARYRETTSESTFDDVRGGGESLFAATRRRLELWDVPQRDIERLLETGTVKRTLTVYAPASGVVTRLGVRSGMEVRPNDNLYTIANLSSVWVLAAVYEYELPWIALGERATMELSYVPDRSFTGTISYVSPFLDPKTRTAEVRVELANADGALKPEMFGTVLLSGKTVSNALVVPTEAVLRSGRRTLVVVALGEGRFEPRDVELGLDSGDGRIQVVRGLAAGDEVVVSSQFLIDSESNLQEAVRKMLSSVPPAAPEPGEEPTADAAHAGPGHGHGE